MEGPWGDADMDALWAQGEAAWRDADPSVTSTVACYWCWSRDARCAPMLLVLPVDAHCATDVAEMCMYHGKLDTDTIALLHMYVRLLRGGPECTRDRAVRICSSATRFLSSHASTAIRIIDGIVDNDPEQGLMPLRTYLQCTAPAYSRATRCLAATLAAKCPRPVCAMVYAHFDDLVALAPISSAAVYLLDQASDVWMDSIDQCKKIIRALTVPSVSAVAASVLCDIANQWTEHAIDCGVVMPLITSGVVMPDAIMRSARHGLAPRNEQHLLVFLLKYGCPPPSALRMMADFLRTAPVATRVMYVREMEDMNRYREAEMPAPEGVLQETHHGCTQFQSCDGTVVSVLTAQLVRYCGYFGAEGAHGEPCVLQLARAYTANEIDVFKRMLYYDKVPGGCLTSTVLRVALLADMLCDARHAAMCVFDAALVDFWPAYDLAKRWPQMKPVLAVAACRQLEQLVRCSRIGEVVDIALGVLL